MSGATIFAGITFPKAVSSRPMMSMAATASPPVAVQRRARSLYEVLKVSNTATAREIKAAYRTMAKRLHPDVAPGGVDDFLEIRRAYETLSDPAARAHYDLSFGRRRAAFVGADRLRPRRWETDQCW